MTVTLVPDLPPLWDDEASGVRIALLDCPAIAAPLPELDYLVRELGLVAGGGAPHLVAGYGYSGKTLALQALALSLASGTKLWGAYPSKPKRVSHVDLEQGERLSRRRYQRLAAAAGIKLEPLADSLVLAAMPSLQLTPDHRSRWLEVMKDRDLCIIDSLRAATAGSDENSSDIRAGLDMLTHLSEETGCRPLVIHHARKPSADDPGGRYSIRGSGAIFDAVDHAWVFGGQKGEPVSVEHVKARSHGELLESFALVIEDVPIGDDRRGGVAVGLRGAETLQQARDDKQAALERKQAQRDAERVRACLTRHPGLGVGELRASVGVPSKRLYSALSELGTVVEVREEKVGRQWVKRHFVQA